MFTGIVTASGSLAWLRAGRARFTCAGSFTSELSIGDSVAVSGCCLTVVGAGDGWFEADVVEETLARTTLGSLEPAAPVNLELPVTPSARLGGHVVQGHVDGTGEVLAPAPALEVAVGPALGRYMVAKGSVALDGVSLTVVSVGALPGDGTAGGGVPADGAPGDGTAGGGVPADGGGGMVIEVAVVPHTAAMTTLGAARAGGRVNVEVDVLAKYVERLLAPVAAAAGTGG
ncbi:MAG: riboflavin synthase [Acidimicrobiales bacterium]